MMTPAKPSLVMQPLVGPSSYVQATRLKRRSTSSYPHISSFRSLLLDMQIYCPSVKVVKHPGLEISQSLPVFGDHDKIEGKVILDPSCSQNGRLTVSLEGTFEYSSVKVDVDEDYPRRPTVRRCRHVFLSSSTVIPILPISDSRSTIREALGVRKRPSMSNMNSPAPRCCEFSFELPRQPGEEMPWTFSHKTPNGDSPGELRKEELQITYQVTAVWEAADGLENQAVLEAPVIIQPDTDFQSVDGSPTEPESWLEMPLIPERMIPFTCAVTLPSPRSFSRCSSIPYFVVFSTHIRSLCRVKEIAADATIAVSLIRKIFVNPQHALQSPILPDTPPSSDESDGRASPFISHTMLRKKSIRALTQEDFIQTQKPLPALPQEPFSTTRTLQTQVSVGFPKRPRVNNASQLLPDGLYKGKLQLSKDMLSSVDLPGFSVKYYLDVSVLVGQDDVRARIPIRVY